MKLRPRKTCKNKGCTNVFIQHKTTDKYCSFQCAKDNAPKARIYPPIKKVSDKRKAESYLYTKKRKIFLAKPENKYCPVAKAVYEGKINPDEFEDSELIFQYEGYFLATEVHHKAGRIGKLLNYVPYWLAVSRNGHEWINANPKKALALGFNLPRTQTNI